MWLDAMLDDMLDREEVTGGGSTPTPFPVRTRMERPTRTALTPLPDASANWNRGKWTSLPERREEGRGKREEGGGKREERREKREERRVQSNKPSLINIHSSISQHEHAQCTPDGINHHVVHRFFTDMAGNDSTQNQSITV